MLEVIQGCWVLLLTGSADRGARGPREQDWQFRENGHAGVG